MRKGWKDLFEVMQGKDLHPRLFYLAKLSFRMEGQIKYFSDKVNLKEFIITKPFYCEMLKGLIYKKIKTMNSKMTINSQLSTTEPKKKKKPKTKQTTRTGTESQKWRSHGGLSVKKGRGKMGGKSGRSSK